MIRASRPTILLVLALVVPVATWMLTRTPGPDGTRPNILLVTLDTLRADHTSCCGYHRATTPRIERLAAEGAIFCDAYCTVPTCAPSHASILTGQYALVTGVVNGSDVLKRDQMTLAERLLHADYATAAAVASFPLSSRFGLSQGFGLYDDRWPPEIASYPVSTFEGLAVPGGFDRRADATTARAVSWLERERQQDRPFFLWVHLFDAHAPYNAPPPHDRLFTADAGMSAAERLVAGYDGEVHFVDESLGLLLSALDAAGLAERTIVVVAGDHGEGLGQHGLDQHSESLYEEAVRVPVIVRWPHHVQAGQRLATPISLIDLAPTLLDLASVAEQGPSMAGHSLARVLLGQERPDPERPIFLQCRLRESGSRLAGPRYGVRAGHYKLIETPEHEGTELFDLTADPGELHNVAGAHPEQTSRLRKLLADWLRLAPTSSHQ
jgi:choline-sulfatase